MATATVTLDTHRCGRETASSSSPYLWPALVVIGQDLSVTVLPDPPIEQDRVVIQKNLQPGQSADIPPSVGVVSFQADAIRVLILVIALWQKRDSVNLFVDVGFKTFRDTLQSAIKDNLLSLGNSQTQQEAIDKIKSTVKNSVTEAILTALLASPFVQQFLLGFLKLDSFVDSSTKAFEALAAESFTVTIGSSSGGRLLSYGD